jgi:transposase
VSLVDLTCFGRSVELVWWKRRWYCPRSDCGVGSWTETNPAIALESSKMTTRAGRWVTHQVGRYARAVSELAEELKCSWHTINSTVMAWGEALLEADTARVGTVRAVGLDETLHERRGRYKTKNWASTITDVATGQLIDLVEGRKAAPVIDWFERQPVAWRTAIRFGLMDLSGPYRRVYNKILGHVRQIADRFHVNQLANRRLDECRRRVQQEQTGHRGRKDDPLYRIRRVLTMGHERLDDNASRRLEAFLAAGDPGRQIADVWRAKEAVRQLYEIEHHPNAVTYLAELVEILTDDTLPPEANLLGRTLDEWAEQIANWHLGRYSNGRRRSQQPDQTSQTSRLRHPPVQPPPRPSPPLHRRPQLGPTPNHHSPLKRGDRPKSGMTDGGRLA